MATYSRKRTVIERIEFHVPAEAPWGAPWVEVVKAISAASNEVRKHHGLASTAVLPDDAIVLRPTDDAVVVSYELSRTEDEG